MGGFGCTQQATVLLWNFGQQSVITQLYLPPDTGVLWLDSGTITIPVSAGTQIEILGTPASGCGFGEHSPSDVFVNVQYVMQ